jgi:hypothetical protein
MVVRRSAYYWYDRFANGFADRASLTSTGPVVAWPSMTHEMTRRRFRAHGVLSGVDQTGSGTLRRRFGRIQLSRIVTAARDFPITSVRVRQARRGCP